MIYLFMLVLAGALLAPASARAGYLDPGSGSTLAQAIAAFVAGISRFFRKLFGREK